MHLNDSTLRAWIDQEISDHQREKIAEHLSHCVSCQERLDVIQKRSDLLKARLDVLTPHQTPDPHAALARFSAKSLRPTHKEILATMFKNRTLWTALAVIAFVAVVFSVTPANAWANDFLGLFRVQKVQVITFDPIAAQNAREQLNVNQDAIEQIFKDDMQVESTGEATQAATVAEANALAGYMPRLPSTFSNTQLAVQPGVEAKFTVHQEKLQALMDATGVDFSIPANLDGQVVAIHVQPSVIASDGCPVDATDVPENAAETTQCTTLIQVPSPIVNAPDGLDLAQIGAAMFQFMGLSPEEAQQISQRIDWTTTLVLPIPQTSSIQYQDVQIDGVTGTLFQSDDESGVMLIWVKDGILYGLQTPESADQALQIAGSLQ